MTGLSKVESFLIDLGFSFQEASPNTFIVDEPERGLPGIAITFDDPIVIVRARVMDVPKGDNLDLFETLLRFNAEDMVHGAYGIEGSEIVLIDSLEYATMDKNEFEAALDSIGLALSRHYPVLGKYRG